jgi:hypothetical protein
MQSPHRVSKPQPSELLHYVRTYLNLVSGHTVLSTKSGTSFQQLTFLNNSFRESSHIYLKLYSKLRLLYCETVQTGTSLPEHQRNLLLFSCVEYSTLKLEIANFFKTLETILSDYMTLHPRTHYLQRHCTKDRKISHL